jgi:hypothetical protein
MFMRQWVTTNVIKISKLEVILYYTAYINFCLYYPHLLSHLDKIWCKNAAHIVAGHRVSWKAVQGRLYICFRCKWKYTYKCTVELHDILKINCAFVKSMYITKQNHLQPCSNAFLLALYDALKCVIKYTKSKEKEQSYFWPCIDLFLVQLPAAQPSV